MTFTACERVMNLRFRKKDWAKRARSYSNQPATYNSSLGYPPCSLGIHSRSFPLPLNPFVNQNLKRMRSPPLRCLDGPRQARAEASTQRTRFKVRLLASQFTRQGLQQKKVLRCMRAWLQVPPLTCTRVAAKLCQTSVSGRCMRACLGILRTLLFLAAFGCGLRCECAECRG